MRIALTPAAITMSSTGCADSAGTAIAANAEAQAIRVAVPRQAYIMIEAAVVADFECTLGSRAAVDFASADAYRIDYPYCYVVRS